MTGSHSYFPLLFARSLSLLDYLCGQAHSVFVFLFYFSSVHVRLLREVRHSFVSSLLCCTACLTHVTVRIESTN